MVYFLCIDHYKVNIKEIEYNQTHKTKNDKEICYLILISLIGIQYTSN